MVIAPNSLIERKIMVSLKNILKIQEKSRFSIKSHHLLSSITSHHLQPFTMYKQKDRGLCERTGIYSEQLNRPKST